MSRLLVLVAAALLVVGGLVFFSGRDATPTTGNPHACASMMGQPNPSVSDGNNKH